MNHIIGAVIFLVFIEVGARVFFGFSPAKWIWTKVREHYGQKMS